MGIKLQTRIETWKKLLLDFGKRNRLINFVEGKRNCIKIISPSPLELYEKIVTNESELSFPFAKKVRFTEDGEEIYEKICDGDILPSKPINETQKTLKNIRSKTRTALEEQGINTLYLTFGMLRWSDNDSSSTYLSPIVLVPVRIIIDSLSSPYRIAIQDDEIVVNPTLCYKLEHDFGIHLPDFDASSDSLESFLQTASEFIDSKGWSIENISYLANLSFLKINMYKDLERNNAKLNSNPIIAALAGETQFFSPSLPDNYNESDAIIEQTSLKSFQVVDADSSQQDAIRLSKRGASFVLQGPPGTGKSQTITNIIAEALADGKKVLFVSEKMAALQVVYNRLAHVGLSDFCFNLHSHKAKKKDILRNLESSINIIRKHVSKEALSHLETLDKKKKYLDSYQAQLHTKTSELDLSIYQVNGKLAELENIPDIYFDIPYIEEITPQIFKGQIDLLCRLSEHIKKCTVTLSENPWRDSNVKRLTISLKREVASNTSKLLSDIDSLDALMNEFYSKSGEGSVNSINTIKEICNHVKVYAQSPLFPLIWMEGDNLSKVSRIVQSVRGKTLHIINLKEKILNRFDKNVFNLDIITIRDSFLDIMARLSEKECGKKYNMLPMAISGIADNTACHIAKLDAIFECANRLTSDLGLGINSSPNDIILLYNTLKIISPLLLFKVPEIWFDENSLSTIKQVFNSHRDLHEITSEQKNTVLSNYDRNVLNIDYNTFLQKFIVDYSSCLRFLKSSYRADIRALSNFAISGRKISYKEAIALLNAIKTIIENEQTINDNIDVFNNYYGCNYNGLATNWNALNDGITTFRDSFSEITLLPDCIKERIICGTLPKSEILQFIRLFESSDVERSLDYLFSAFNKDFNIFSKYSDIRIFGLSTCESARKFKESYDSISQASIEEPDFENLLDGVKIIYNHHNATEIFANNRDYHELWLGHFFNGLETDWDSIIAARKYASFLKNTIKEGGVTATTIQKVCEDFSFISFCKDISEKLEELSIKVENDIIWFSSLFEKTTDFSSENILNVAERASLCKKNIQLIQEWIDYRSLKEESEKLEIFDYLQALESIHIDPDTIVDIYKKRLYSLWLDMHLPQFPAVMRFNLDTHTRTINEFCSLDNAQFRIAQARVRERVVKRIPDFNKIHSTKDEIAILKREINKQRKVMPLRKLFQSIPRLLTSLRPCFMMSPLSVSVFLEAASYDFDMVIFDEASQVHTEDAIGSIMRGKQVIIVGDTRQLPPTSFFTASLNDGEFDSGAEQNDEINYKGAFDSILDEAATILPERSLRWHYRSRHEDLIAFSNIRIYDRKLITFPSSTEAAPNLGVEYIYVNNGIYDRGGKKTNIPEANRVAQLVIDHFRNHPERSIGVVSFSEAQQYAIDIAIQRKRMLHPELESFFLEDREEPFFIKNLENVQGDERDTIIFSIGYGKDKEGVMHMNFGPLSQEGGYRRLNVAITRAKYNIKLVGSILPADINLDKVSSDGVRMLRSYIEFAQHGITVLENGDTIENEEEYDSSFEKVVYDFLVSQGYEVSTNVGSSDFKIDLAVKHPGKKDIFAIGIECDGPTYHATRTVRERDRLRTAVLNVMGWNIFRIWSTEWVKNPESEKKRLIDAIESSLNTKALSDISPVSGNNNPYNSSTPLSYVNNLEIEIVNNEDYYAELSKAFMEYEMCDFFGIDVANTPLEQLITLVVKKEQPIHLEEVCRRILNAMGRKNLTSQFMDDVISEIESSLKGKVVYLGNDFLRWRGVKLIEPRTIKSDNTYLRPINHVCKEEFSAALLHVVKNHKPMTKEKLIYTTAKYFGFNNIIKVITDPISLSLTNLIKNKELIVSNGKVFPAII